MEDYYSFDELTSKAKTRKEVADEFGIDVKTLNSKLENTGIFIKPGSRLFPKDLVLIYNALGTPKVLRKVSQKF
jgi:hypothetical protein